MLTIKLPITYCSNNQFITDKLEQYNYAFRLMFKTIEESCTKEYENKVKERFKMNDIEYRSLKSEVESFIKKQTTSKDKINEKIINKTDELNDLLVKKQIKPLPKKEKKLIYKLYKSIDYLTNSLNHNVVFGGRKNLQHLTHLHNQYNNKLFDLNNEYEQENILSIENQLVNLNNSIIKQKDKFTNQRLWSFNLMGEANQKGNRFIDFSELIDGKITYKPKQGIKIDIDVKVNKNRLKVIKQLVDLSNNKDISISVSLCNNFICLTYDDSKLSGFTIDEKARRVEVEKIKSTTSDKDLQTLLIKNIYKEHYDKLRSKMLVGKIHNRCLSIDMNPSYIGVSVLERDTENENVESGEHKIKIINTFCYSLKHFTKKLPQEATDIEREYHRNKHKHEIKEIFIQIFNILNHYKCSMFVMEDLDFKESKEKDKKTKEVNRQTKNIWYRGLIEQMIQKLCTEFGIELVKVNPSYSSFIGNVMYDYFDPINSSIEIGRRGLYKYIKNLTGFPLISKGIVDTMDVILLQNNLDVLLVNGTKMTWKIMFNLNNNKYRYRGSLAKHRDGSLRKVSRCSMSTKKSGIKVLI
jgi:IS605 OrfB family transposase